MVNLREYELKSIIKLYFEYIYINVYTSLFIICMLTKQIKQKEIYS